MKHTLTLEPLLTVTDIMEIFGVTAVTVYRWISLARKGKHRFPLPIGDHKQQHRWSREAILAYQNAGNPRAPPTIEPSAAQRTSRHRAAMDRLLARGVKVKVAPKPDGDEG
jgi:transposase-like protein